jgi:MoxR-like ATPase
MKFPGAMFHPEAGTQPGTGGYVYHDPRIVLAVNVALATGRPLLISGVPGSGKSTLAADVAARLQWSYIGITVTSRTRLEDLVARVDSVRRLADAQVKKLRDDAAYLVPGVLWWAFDAASAMQAAGPDSDIRVNSDNAGQGIVVLLDEIDKAEPDLPNDLLQPLDRLEIIVPGGRQITAGSPVLLIITSNGERAMPPAFLRRCVILELDDDDPSLFTAVATSHFGPRQDTLYADVATCTRALARLADEERRRGPSMAEYLDSLRACLRFEQRPPSDSSPGSDLWEAIEEAALRKTRTSAIEPSGA